MPVIAVGEWMPDQADLNNPGSAVIQNVIPRTQTSYGPMAGLSSSSLALSNRCQGAIGVRNTDGNGYDFAGDSTKLYYLNAGASAWTDVSKSGGYNIAADDQWKFTFFYDNLIATNISDNIQSYVIGSSSAFADLSTGAPKARYIAMVRDFCVVGNTTDSTNGARPQRVWWSAIGDPTTWPTPGTSTAAADQSDFQDVSGDHGWLQGIVPNIGPVDAALFFQRAVFRMMYVGSPDIFSILPARGVKGCIAPASLVNTEIGAFYLGPDGFYIFDGVEVIPVGYQKVDKWFFSNVDISHVGRVVATLDPYYPIVWVAFPSSGNAGGNPDTIIGCNYRLPSSAGTPGRWCELTGVTSEFMFRAVSLGYDLEQLDNVGNGTLEGLPASLDSQIWQGSAQDVLAAFDASHTLNYFAGSNLAPTVQTTEVEPFPGRRGRIKRALPLVDGGTPSLAVGTRNQNESSVTFGAAVAMNSEGFCPLNADSRYLRLQLTLPANTAFNHIKGVDVPDDHLSQTGAR